MAEGGEGEDEIQFLRTVSKRYSASASFSPINAFGGRHAAQPINPSSRPPRKKWIIEGGKFGGAEMSILAFPFSLFLCFFLFFRVCKSDASVEVGAGLRGAPVDGTPDVRNLNETQPRRWCKGSTGSTPSPSLPPPPPSTAASLFIICPPGCVCMCVCALCGCMDCPPPGERSFSKLRSHVSPPLSVCGDYFGCLTQIAYGEPRCCSAWLCTVLIFCKRYDSLYVGAVGISVAVEAGARPPPPPPVAS